MESNMLLPSFKMYILGLALLVAFGAFTAHSEQAQTSTDGSLTATAANGHQVMISEGHSLFNQTCAHCHGPDASTGLPERNLRHLRARYGDDMHSVFETTVMKGRPDKGMPVWGGVLDAKAIDSIYGYLETIQENGD
jgi:mono/diheme cytochrome c family protein